MVGTIPVGQNPTGIGINTDGNSAMVANSGSNTTYRINPSNSQVSCSTVGSSPQQIAYVGTVGSIVDINLVTN